ncbi:MAG: NADH-quinone oxidoreductase subunit NuoF [Candidatus Heimdallarchaeota archaeon]|nr:NADH-quinone oxidoreductase subunit NuoF [Candidatus Heimdallarchaeota archaeon]MCK5048688.1 NADH-quinone oxidoreductase subunit NuoF [Candidatus Heimdallarchaeota archaeon]
MKVRVGLASCGISAGGQVVYDEFESEISKLVEDKKIELSITGCLGICFAEPIVDVIDDEGKVYRYTKIDKKKTQQIVQKHLIEGQPIDELLINTDPIFAQQVKIVLRNCGFIDPESIEAYEEVDGYKAIRKALDKMTKEEVIEEVKESGLRGRGGAGFSTGMKWMFAANNPNEPRYIICNADEGDPGAFANRAVLEGDPHAVLEGMMLAAYSMGCEKGYIYCRAEYPLAVERLQIAIDQAREKGYLGYNIMGSGFDFDLEIFEGAGAFVCGEETALMQSIEGARGMPRLRPPYPAQKGLFGQPTTINNVETLADIPYIILHGGAKYYEYGIAKSRGTKVFSVAGKVRNGGLVEVPMGMSLRNIICDICDGIKDDKKVKAVQLGGPSGGCLPESLLDTVVDYETLTETGAIVGSGGMIVADETTCMVDLARFFLSFTQQESCGKCTFCRIGTKRMLEILNNICDGKGKVGDIEELERLGTTIKNSSLCALGGTAPNPVLTTIRYFRQEYDAHITEQRCPAKSCKALITYEIIDGCVGCGSCVRVCPSDAIIGTKRKGDVDLWREEHGIFVIIDDKCIRCHMCIASCRYDAIEVS